MRGAAEAMTSERAKSPSTGNACSVCGEPMLGCDYGKWFQLFDVYLCSKMCALVLKDEFEKRPIYNLPRSETR